MAVPSDLQEDGSTNSAGFAGRQLEEFRRICRKTARGIPSDLQEDGSRNSAGFSGRRLNGFVESQETDRDYSRRIATDEAEYSKRLGLQQSKKANTVGKYSVAALDSCCAICCV